jgi:hypothetical protein
MFCLLTKVDIYVAGLVKWDLRKYGKGKVVPMLNEASRHEDILEE